MEEPAPGNKRRYRGMDGHERVAVRRAKLIEAGLELFGTKGYGATTVEDVCQQAGLAKRYFYESFADREALLATVYDAEIEGSMQAILGAVAEASPAIEDQISGGLSAFIRYFATDRRKGRVVFIEIIRAGEGVEARYRQARHRFADLIITMLTNAVDTPRTPRIELGVTGLVGAVDEIMWDWLLGHQKSTIDEIVDGCVLIFNLLHQQHLREISEPQGH